MNADGLAFKWAGYRMPEDLGVAVQVQKIENYLSARVIAAYDYLTGKDAGREVDGFSVPSASLFAAGPLGERFGAYLEFERTPDAAIDLIGSISGVWGREKRYGGFRIGQGHLLMASGGVAGFDRPTGIAMPLAYGEPVTAAIPVRLGGDQVGLEAFVVLGGRNRTAVQVLNGVVVGAGEGGAAVTNKDIVLNNQLIWDDAGSGLGLTAYFGNATGLVPDQPGISKQFYRLSATASKIVNRAELMGGYVYGKDTDLPAEGAGPATSPTGESWWMQAGYTLEGRNALTLFGRYEFLNPDRSQTTASRNRSVAGAVLPMSLPEYLRWSVEVYRDSYRSPDVPRRDGIATRLQVVF